MAVASFHLRYAGKSGSLGARGAESRSVVYVATTTASTDTEDDVLAAGPFAIGDAYSVGGASKPNLLCYKIAIKQEDARERTWAVTYDFSYEPPGGKGGDNPGENDPLKWIPRYTTRKEKRQRVLYIDKAGNPVINSAGGRFAQPVMENRSRLVVTCSRNEMYFNIGMAVDYFDAVNSDVFWGQPAGNALCEAITGSKVWQKLDSGILGYWEVSYEIHFDRDGFNPTRVLDCGSFALKDVGGVKKKYIPRDKDGIPCPGPILLDGAGDVLPDDQVVVGGVVYVNVVEYDTRPFSALNLPPPT